MNNLIRCSVGAAGVAVVDIVINSLGAGFTFLLFAGLTGLASPLLAVEWIYGHRWRAERMSRLKAQEDEKKAGDLEAGD